MLFQHVLPDHFEKSLTKETQKPSHSRWRFQASDPRTQYQAARHGLRTRCQHVRVRCQGDWGRGTGGGESVRLFCWWSLIVQKETHSHAEMKQLNTQRRARSLSIIKTKLPLWTKWPGLGKMKIKKKQQHMTIFLHTNAGLAVWFLVFSFSFQLLISHPHPPHPPPPLSLSAQKQLLTFPLFTGEFTNLSRTHVSSKTQEQKHPFFPKHFVERREAKDRLGRPQKRSHGTGRDGDSTRLWR